MDTQQRKEFYALQKQVQDLAKRNIELRSAVGKLNNELIRTKAVLKRTTENCNRNRKDINSINQPKR